VFASALKEENPAGAGATGLHKALCWRRQRSRTLCGLLGRIHAAQPHDASPFSRCSTTHRKLNQRVRNRAAAKSGTRTMASLPARGASARLERRARCPREEAEGSVMPLVLRSSCHSLPPGGLHFSKKFEPSGSRRPKRTNCSTFFIRT